MIAGPSSLDVYLKSSRPDTDLQVTLSEVRPDGNETYVQNGWLRASHRKLDARASTALDPFPTHLKQDAAPLPQGPLRARARADLPGGPRVPRRVADPRDDPAPGGDRPRWDFATVDKGNARNTVALGGARASSLVLPVVAGATAKGTPLPGADRAARRAQPRLRARLQRRLGARAPRASRVACSRSSRRSETQRPSSIAVASLRP